MCIKYLYLFRDRAGEGNLCVSPGAWGCSPNPCMNHSWLPTEAGRVTHSMQHVLSQKRVINGQKGQWELGDLLIIGPKRGEVEGPSGSRNWRISILFPRCR